MKALEALEALNALIDDYIFGSKFLKLKIKFTKPLKTYQFLPLTKLQNLIKSSTFLSFSMTISHMFSFHSLEKNHQKFFNPRKSSERIQRMKLVLLPGRKSRESFLFRELNSFGGIIFIIVITEFMADSRRINIKDPWKIIHFEGRTRVYCSFSFH